MSKEPTRPRAVLAWLAGEIARLAPEDRATLLSMLHEGESAGYSVPASRQDVDLPSVLAEACRGLNKRQKAFVEAYWGHCKYNAAKAAIAAGYSPKHARQSGHQVAKSPKVCAAMEAVSNAVFPPAKSRSASQAIDTDRKSIDKC